MKAEKWDRVSELCHSALALDQSKRQSFLDTECAGDVELRNEIESRILQESTPSGFMNTAGLGNALKASAAEALEQPFLQATTKLTEGSRLGPYEILGPLGEGGMGQVYRARDVRVGREVAVKVLSSNISSDLQALQRFEREAHAIAQLSHPNICTLFDLGVQEGTNYIVMELLRGETLREVIASRVLDLPSIIQWAKQIVSALQAAHSYGIIHRDVKPGNIMITELGISKLLDFGLAKFFKPGAGSPPADDQLISTDITMCGVPFGTVPYMSPEQARGQSMSPQSDLFSFGAVLYEMFTGRRAFPGSSTAEILASVLNTFPIPASRLNPAMPHEMDRIIERLLEKSPEARYASATDLIADLAALSAKGPSAARVLVSTVAAHPTLKDRLQSIAILPLLDLSSDTRADYFADGLTEALITAIARLGKVRVISRTSAMCYKNTAKSLPEIAQELNVDLILEGSVLRSGESVRINCRLVDPRAEDQLWGESFDHRLGDILAVHDDLTEAIATRLQTSVREHSHPPASIRRNVSPEAYDSWLRGRYFWNKRNEPNLRKAIECFQRALDLDPCYAPAWAGVADSYFYLGYSFGRMKPDDAMPKAKAAALRAIELDPHLGEAYISLGMTQFLYDWDPTSAEANVKRGLELNPSSSHGHHFYAILRTAHLRVEEALQHIYAARQADPLSLPINNFIGLVHFAGKQYESAIESSRATLEMDPNFGLAHAILGASLEATGAYDEAAEEYFTSLAVGKRTREEWDAIRRGYQERGMVGLHEEDLNHMLRRWDGWHGDMFTFAALHAGLGHVAESLDWLEKACDLRSGPLIWLRSGSAAGRIAHYFENLRGEPRFERILDSIHLPK
jgi:serine/threonine protein kinase/tetratricopeptide (TPR) repeat protein